MLVAFAVIAALAIVALTMAVLLFRVRGELKRTREHFAPILSVEEERDRVAAEREALTKQNAEQRISMAAERERAAAQIAAEKATASAEISAERERFAAERSGLESQIRQARSKWESDYQAAMDELARLTREVEVFSDQAELQSFGFYKAHYDFESSAQYKARLTEIQLRQEAMLKNKVAAVCGEPWVVDGSAAKGRQMVERQLKLQLRAFNGEADAAIARVRYNNIVAMEERIRRAHAAINMLGKTVKCEITHEYAQLKIDELRLSHEYEAKVQAEKEEQREIRERMREEEIAQREIEKAQKEAEKEEQKFEQALKKAQQEIEGASQKEKEKLESKITELERKLAEAHANKEKAISMAQLTKSGHVYVISNIGSFGEQVYKVGMTRRLEPMDRVKELGDASVPFTFDVHALIYTENAPDLERQLHVKLEERRVNMVNNRKEFFRVTLDEIEVIVRGCAGASIEFTRAAEAAEYRQTQALLAEKAAAARNSLPPSPAKDLIADAKAGFEKVKAMLDQDAAPIGNAE